MTKQSRPPKTLPLLLNFLLFLLVLPAPVDSQCKKIQPRGTEENMAFSELVSALWTRRRANDGNNGGGAPSKLGLICHLNFLS